jgi:hypothetical protein
MEIYQDLIDVHLGGQSSNNKINLSVLNMLNTRYIISGAPTDSFANSGAAGNAWFVSNIKPVKTADDEILSLKGNNLGEAPNPTAWDPLTTAVMRTSYFDKVKNKTPGKSPNAAIRLTKYGLNDLAFSSQNDLPGLAVFSDIWYPFGWEATIDGKPVEILRVNYVLRSIEVPAGRHNIEFHFRPASWEKGNMISKISSFAIIALLGAAIAMLFRKPKVDLPGNA